MKKPLLLIISILFGMTVQAGSVSEQEALQKAEAFMQGKSFKKRSLRRALSGTIPNNAYYVFNVENDGGFVIVSGDDRTKDILGYAEHGNLDLSKAPTNVRWWLEQYEKAINNLGTMQTNTPRRTGESKAAIAPFVTTTWGQYAPYNQHCPDVFGELAPTGCVATAMAQIMYHYQFPQQTRKAIHGYPSNDPTYDIYLAIADIPVTTIEWEDMLPKYESDYSEEQGDAVAQLMQLCGTSIRTKYGQGESGATLGRVIKAFPRYFGYSTDISLAWASEYEPDVWNQLMYDELAASRPIIYSGSGDEGGHTFIIDGYDKDDYFHINWGWGGDENGFFLLSVLLDYNNDQCAIIGIQPSTTNVPDAYGVLENGTMTLYYDTEMNTRSGQVFDDLVSYDFFDYLPLETEVLVCPSEDAMTNCVIDPSFADYELETLDNFFYQCSNLKTITGLGNLNTSHVKNMETMFLRCTSLESIDFTGFRTDNILDMGWMFRDCSSLKSLDLSSFNTENVIIMEGMFYGCSSLESIDFSSFNTEKTEFMDWMFRDCSSLKALDLSSFNTKSLLTMYSTFEGCTSMTDLDISNFKTNNVVDMAYTFRYCESLKNLDLSHFNTENVTQMSAMFEGCTSLESLNLHSFNTGNVRLIYDMFFNCYSLKTLDISGFNTSNVIGSMERMFSNCLKLESLDLSGFYTANVTNMYTMFACCYSLKSLDLKTFDTSQVIDMSGMFSGCHSLTNLDLGNFNTDNVTNMRGMFQGCSLLTSLDISNFNTSNVTDMTILFADCRALNTIYVGDGWNTDGITDVERNGDWTFGACEQLVGEKGTVWSKAHQNIDYAHIDGGPDNPGYLSLKRENTLLGDGTGDGVVDISDYIGVANYILGIPQTGFNVDAADVNKDGVIDISDYIGVANIILTGKP